MEQKMKGISFSYNSDTQFVTLSLLPAEMEKEADLSTIKSELASGAYSDFYLSEKALK